jgi:hypothetical protein
MPDHWAPADCQIRPRGLCDFTLLLESLTIVDFTNTLVILWFLLVNLILLILAKTRHQLYQCCNTPQNKQTSETTSIPRYDIWSDDAVVNLK